MKYKRTQKRSKQMWQRVEKFSIRKFSFGAASCLIGASLVGVAINPNIVDAAFKQLNGEDGIVSLYSNSGETPESADGIEIGSKVNVDKEIGIDVDWSEYTRENPIVKVTYTFNGGADGSSVAGFGGHRPRFWFTTPIGLKEPKEITLKKNDGRPVYVMESWNKNKKFGSLSNSINSRFQTEDDINRAYREIDFRGNDTKWESYNETTGESYREYSGSFANKFWYHIGERISDDPYEQAIYESFRTNTKTMYVDWERGGIERATITAVYEVADPTFGNDRSTLEFGAGFRVGIARMMQHYKTVLAPVPSLYKLNEIFEPSVPTRVAVKDTNKLTEAEKNIVRDRLWSANKENVTSVARTGKNKLIENLKSEEKTESILIGDDGTATIIYSDNTRDVIPGTSLVYKVTETNTHRQGGGYEYDIAPVAVKNMDQITEEEKKAAIKSFLKANGIGIENLQYHSGKSELDFEGGTLQDDKGNKWFAYDENTANAKNIGTHIGFTPNSSTVMLSRDAGFSGVYTIPTSDLYYKEGTSALDLAKKDAEAAIDNLNYLSPKEKQAFKEKLKDKTTQESVNAVVEEAVAKNSENERALEAKKREVKEKINNNPYLTTAEKKELVDQVSAVVMTDPTEGTATPIEHTKGLVDKVLDKALEKTKEKAKAIIDEIDKNGGQAGYLENPTAAQYKEQIQNATTQEAITKVIEDAQNQKSKKAHDAEKAKTDALKDEYKKKIDQVPGLTDAQKDEYKKQIDAATTRDQLEDIVKDAEVKAYRDTAKAKIDALEHLNAAQKAELKTQVDAAGNKAEVDNIVSIAQGLDSKMDSLQKLVAEAEKVKASDKYTNPNVPKDKKTAFDTANAAASKVADKTTAEPENAAGTSEVATLIDNLAKAIEALTGEKVAVPVSKDALKAEIDLNTDDAVKKSPAYAKEANGAKKQAYDDALVNAQKVYDNPDATQTDVDNALDTLKQARLALSGKAEDFTLGVKDGAAKISVEPKADAELAEADKDAVKAKVTANGNALDDTYTVEYGAIAEKGDKKVVPVTVTHDGITRTVDVPVEGNTAATTTPTADTAKLSETPKVNDIVTKAEDVKAIKDAVKVPEGTQVTDKKLLDEGKVVEGTDQSANGGANNAGKPVVKVEVTYGDGSKDVVEVPVEGNTAATTTPTVDTAKLSETPKVNDTITKPEDVKAIKDAVKVTVPAGQKEPTKSLVDNGKVVAGTDQSANGGANNTGKPVVKVEVTYADGSKDVVEVPVEGNTAATTTPTVDTAKLSETPKENDTITKPEDVKAIKDAVKVIVPAGQAEPTKELVDGGKVVAGTDQTANGGANNTGKPVVKVEVTYADGSKDVVEVPVEGNTAATTTPTADTAKLSETPKVNDIVTKAEDVKAIKDAVKVTVPAGQAEPTKELVDGGKVVAGTDQSANGGANNTGKPVVKVEVTYADGSKDVVEVPVEGNTAATTTPTADTAKLSETPKVNDTITKAEDVKAIKDAVKVTVPAGQAEPTKELVDGGKVVAGTDQTANGGANNTGKPVVKVEVTYADGSKDVVEVPVEGTDAAKATPKVKEEITAGEVPVSVDPATDKKVAEADKKAITEAVVVPEGQPQPADKQVKNDGTIVAGTGANAGKKVVVVEVTYGDGSKDEIEVPVRKEKDADKATPKVKEEITAGEVPVSVDPSKDKQVAEADKKAITDAVVVPEGQPQPTDKQVKNDGAIVDGTGANAGKKVVVVEVTYPDGSKDEIEVPVRKATDKEKAKADLTEAANAEKGEIGGDTTLTDKEKEDLKAKVDEVKKAAEEKINNAKTSEEIAKATEEGKKAIADVYNPQTAKGQSTNVFKPELDLQTALVSGKVTVEKGKDLTDEEILKQLALADGVTAKVISKPTTTETGTKEAEVEVTLADGNKVTVKVPVEVVDSLDTADKDNDLAKAKEDAKKQVEEAAKAKITEIKKDTGLTEEQKQKAEEAINKAKDEANKAIDEASSAGTAKQIADQAKENIEKYDPKADTEVKKPDVTNLDEEKAKAKAEILEEAQKRIDEIKNNKDLSDEAKQKAIEEINKAKDKAIEDINKGQSKDEINAAKEAGIHKINEVQPEGSIASKFEPKVPENKVEVENPAKLSDKEREQVRQNIEGANTFPDGTTVEVKPDGTAVITYKDGSSDTISKDKLATPAKKETGTIASRTEPVIPERTQVGNTTKLTPEEQAAVKKAVEGANNFPAGTTVEVRPDGTVVITYPDKSVDTITGDKLVEKGSKQETPKVQTDAEKNPAQIPGNFVPVENTHNLTQAEQDTVAAKVKEANPAATAVKVSKDGTATLTYSDGSVNTIPGTSLVVAKDTENEVATQAAQNPAVVPATTEVGNAHSLTPEEQAAVTAKVQVANPAATAVKVSKDGTATLTYSDGSVNTIPGTSLVVQKEETSTQEQPTIAEKTKVIIPANPTKVAEATRLTDAEKEAVKKAVVEANGFGSDVNVEVAGDGTATIVFKDGSAVTIPGNQLVAQDPKAQDSTKPAAEKSTVKAPAQRVDVKDITHLTDEEKEKVKVAILQANGSALDGATINVAGDGTATITFPDGSVVTILGKDTVQQFAKGESVTQETTPEYTPESTPGGDNGGNTGSSDANANAGGGSNAGEPANTGSQIPAQSQASKQLANAKESAKNVIEKAAKDKQDEINGAPLSDKEKAELLARVEAEKQAALKEIENAKTVEDVKEAETIGVQAIASVTVPKKPVAPNAAPQATSAPQATAGTMQDVTYQSPAGKQLPNTGSASSAALASLGLVAATSGFALLGRKARRRK